jgi:hypothetical protein
LDISYAVYTALAAYVCAIPQRQKQEKEAVKAWEILKEGCEAHLADIIFGPAKMLIDARLGSLGGQKLAEASLPVMKYFSSDLITLAHSAYDQGAE